MFYLVQSWEFQKGTLYVKRTIKATQNEYNVPTRHVIYKLLVELSD